MKHFCDDLIYEIFCFIPNETILILPTINTHIKNLIYDPNFIEYIQYRPHPMVFNALDNYCLTCNLVIFFYFNTDIKHITCDHTNTY